MQGDTSCIWTRSPYRLRHPIRSGGLAFPLQNTGKWQAGKRPAKKSIGVRML
jgi:hypothetical protein